MIRNIEIKNFKSVADLKLELGRFNILIGENGCGKSNILEAIAIGGAASANKLDSEFLSSRGIRVTEPTLMRSAFKKKNLRETINLKFSIEETNGNGKTKIKEYLFKLQNRNRAYSKWFEVLTTEISSSLEHIFAGDIDFLKNKLPESIKQGPEFDIIMTMTQIIKEKRRKGF